MKKILSVLLSLVMALGLLATTAWADTHTNHCVCCGNYTGTGHTSHETVNWQPWPATETTGPVTSLPTDAGNYYLTADVMLTSKWKVNVNIGLCLNGHTITANNTGSDKEYILVEGATLNLTDCTGSGIITATNSSTDISQLQKVVVVACWTGSQLNMYGGKITGINAGNYNGGGVHNEGIFNMYGGEISDNTAKNGGGVENWTDSYVEHEIEAVFNFYGGTIKNNTATENGGGVYNTSAFNMYGGTISDNYVGADKYGTGVYNAKDTGERGTAGYFTFTGGTVSGDVFLERGTKAAIAAYLGDGATLNSTGYAVAFNSNGGSAVAGQTLIGTGVKAIKPTNPTREGYTFLGWYNGDTLYVFDTVLTGDLFLTAKWEALPEEPVDEPAVSGGHTPVRRQNTTTTTTDTTTTDTAKVDTVTSAKTFDVGSAVYGVMAVASVLGMGYVGKKRG